VSLVDNGNFFPEADTHQDAAWFLMDAMKILGVDAVGASPNELRFGYAFLKSNIKRTQLPLTSANLIDVATRRPAFEPYLIKKAGSVRVGYFSLMTDKADLGPPRDSLRVDEPTAVARRTVAELRKKGATVVVLLSQLGKVESEDLVTAVPGIDVVICGRNVPVIQKGRMIKNTVASYGGDQGQFISRTLLTLDKAHRVTAAENETFQLGPEVGDRADIAKLVKTFEDGFNDKLRRLEKERAAQQGAVQKANEDHFLGADLCARCHQAEFDQWKTTSHAVAWNTLVDQKKDGDESCIGCHVVGYKQNGGFVPPPKDAATAVQVGNTALPAAGSLRLAHVQCESCHGMGTRHEAFAARPQKVTRETCVGCHDAKQDPNFSYEKELARIAHANTSGETIKNKKVKGAAPAGTMGGH
jgi:hypothetical protein